MDEEHLRQRVKYLLEHGGLWDDPIADLHRRLDRLTTAVAVASSFGAVAVVLHALDLLH